MIQLFVSDIDGCLSEPFKQFEQSTLEKLARYNSESLRNTRGRAIPVSICSGRSYPYVEAMTQVLGLHMPVLFDAGAGLFDPQATTCEWHPAFDSATRNSVGELVVFLEGLIKNRALQIDYAKRTQAGLAGTNPQDIEWARKCIAAHVEEYYPSFRTYSTPVSVDVVPAYLDKRIGLEWLCEKLGLSMSNIAYIGDTEGDIDALRAAGRSYAPANAHKSVKSVVDVVTLNPLAKGVLEAYEDVLTVNSRQ